jgi:hypothetical protein
MSAARAKVAPSLKQSGRNHAGIAGDETVETTAYGCEVLFSSERAQAVQNLIEGATGKPCPCKQGKTCPLLPRVEKPEASFAA